jgi:hypothetical protein
VIYTIAIVLLELPPYVLKDLYLKNVKKNKAMTLND